MRPAVLLAHIATFLGCIGFGPAFHPADAAEIKHLSSDEGIELITIEGVIVSGDEQKFRKLSIQYDKAVVALSSDGGALLSAIEIGKMIRLKEYTTLVLDEYQCTSACALIWIAGSTRFLAPSGRVGFHASYRDEGGRKVETGLGNALVGRYLTLLNLPEKAVLFATAASPYEVLWLSSKNMREAGINFEVFGDESDPVSAAGPPTNTATATNSHPPDPGETVYSEGLLLWRDGKYDQSINVLRAFISAFPKHRRVSYANDLVGRALFKKGQPRAAAEWFLANYRSYPMGERAPDSLYYLGLTLMALNQPGQACKAYKELEEVYLASGRADLRAAVSTAKTEARCF